MVEVKPQQDEEVWYLFPFGAIQTSDGKGNLHFLLSSFNQNWAVLLEAEVSQARQMTCDPNNTKQGNTY